MAEDALVEVDATEALDPLWIPDCLEALGRAPRQRRVERAAPEVVDRYDLARPDPLQTGVVQSRSQRLGQQRDTRA